MKRILVALILVATVASGAMAQLMFGVSGALHMDNKLTASDIKGRFDSGEGIFYGGFVEIAGKHLGLGVTGNLSSYTGDVNVKYSYDNVPQHEIQLTNVKLTDYDLTAYLSYHLFGASKILDPFGEFGGGLIATGFQDSQDTDSLPWDSPFLAASYYWYAGLGLGVNLGPIGVFGKFSYNYPLKSSYKADFKDTKSDGSPSDLSGSTELGPFGLDSQNPDFVDGYLPKYRFTAGIKLIL